MPGEEGIPQLVLLRVYQRFVGGERAIMLFGQKLFSQLSVARPPCRGATPDLLQHGAAYRGDKAAAGFACLSLMVRSFSPELKSNNAHLAVKRPDLAVKRQFFFNPAFDPGISDQLRPGTSLARDPIPILCQRKSIQMGGV